MICIDYDDDLAIAMPAGWLSNVVNPRGDLTTMLWDAADRRVGTQLANGINVSLSYDNASQLRLASSRIGTGTVVLSCSYTRDNAGNPTNMSEQRLTSGTLATGLVTWTYDPTYQLTAEKRTGSLTYDVSNTNSQAARAGAAGVAADAVQRLQLLCPVDG